MPLPGSCAEIGCKKALGVDAQGYLMRAARIWRKVGDAGQARAGKLDIDQAPLIGACLLIKDRNGCQRVVECHSRALPEPDFGHVEHRAE